MFIKRLLLIFILFLSNAYLIGKWFDQRYKKRWPEIFFNSSDTLTKGKTDYDIIFIGNSRAHFGLNPYYIDSVTGANSYNFGIGGADAATIRMSGATYLGNHAAPKIAVIEVDEGMLRNSKQLNILYHFLFYLDDDSVYKHMRQADFPFTAIRYLPFLKYAYLNEYNRTSIFVKGNVIPVFDHNIYKGFVNGIPDTSTNNMAGFGNATDTSALWPVAENYITELISDYQKRGSQVILLFPPIRKYTYHPGKLTKDADSIFVMLAKKCHVPVLDLKLSKNYEDKYFADDIHLNGPGSTILSLEVGDSLKKYFRR